MEWCIGIGEDIPAGRAEPQTEVETSPCLNQRQETKHECGCTAHEQGVPVVGGEA